jgi:hypothetical protein
VIKLELASARKIESIISCLTLTCFCRPDRDEGEPFRIHNQGMLGFSHPEALADRLCWLQRDSWIKYPLVALSEVLLYLASVHGPN